MDVSCSILSSDPPLAVDTTELVQTNVSVPVRVDAFALSEKVCNSDYSKIAPLSQPNYLFLRYTDNLVEGKRSTWKRRGRIGVGERCKKLSLEMGRRDLSSLS